LAAFRRLDLAGRGLLRGHFAWWWRCMPKKVLERAAGDQKSSTHSQGGDLACAHEVVSAPARDPQKIASFLHGVGEALKHRHRCLHGVQPTARWSGIGLVHGQHAP
jgi:hypothetical protein